MKKKLETGIIYSWDFEHEHIHSCPICSDDLEDYIEKKKEAIESEFLIQLDCECGMRFQFLI